MVEQPTVGLSYLAEVTAHARVPIIADESCWDAADALELVQRRAADCISIYLAKAGGFVGARAVAAIAESQHIPCDINGSIESAIGNAANTHFVLAHAAVSLASVIPISAPAGAHPYRTAGRYYEDDIISEAFAVKDGAILPLNRAGLGIEVDEKRLAKYRCDLWRRPCASRLTSVARSPISHVFRRAVNYLPANSRRRRTTMRSPSSRGSSS
jgi:L-alanine-DL-glutamate epimerase-like enolase superfamily enzyme